MKVSWLLVRCDWVVWCLVVKVLQVVRTGVSLCTISLTTTVLLSRLMMVWVLGTRLLGLSRQIRVVMILLCVGRGSVKLLLLSTVISSRICVSRWCMHLGVLVTGRPLRSVPVVLIVLYLLTACVSVWVRVRLVWKLVTLFLLRCSATLTLLSATG